MRIEPASGEHAVGSPGAPSGRNLEPTHRSAAARGFEQYTHEIYGWAYRLLGRHHDALDVVQEVFLRWDRQCAEDKPQQPRGWLRRVTVNLAIDVRRHRQAGPNEINEGVLAGAQGTVPLASGGSSGRSDTGIEAIDREALRDDIAAAMSRLTDVQQAVLMAKVYDEMTFAAIAVELDLAVSTVKTHYLRAVRAVRDRLEPRWAKEE